MPRGYCHRHGEGHPCSCSMGNLYRFVEPLVLYLLKKQGKTYGYELMGAVQQHALTDSIVEPGALYRTLRKLEENGFVVSIWDASSTGPARRIYELTDDGEDHLLEWTKILKHLSESMSNYVSDVLDLLQNEYSSSQE